jgi:hypothetical protein
MAPDCRMYTRRGYSRLAISVSKNGLEKRSRRGRFPRVEHGPNPGDGILL